MAEVWSQSDRDADPRRRPRRRPDGLLLRRPVRRRCATTCCRCPGCPAELADAAAQLHRDGYTLPLPVPADQVTSSTAEVNGAPATVLATRDRPLAAVVWVDHGVVTAVAGSLDADEVLSIARDLR